MHLGGRVDRHVVGRRRRRTEPGLFLDAEHLSGPGLDGAVDAHPGPLPTPRLGSALRVGEIDEALAGEEALAHERHGPLHARLVLRGAHPRRVDHEPAGLRVLDERLVQPRLERVGPLDDRLHVVGDHRREHATEERPRRFAPGDHVLDRLTERQPHEAVARHDRREDQRVTHPPTAAVGRAPGRGGRSRPAARRPARRQQRAPCCPAGRDRRRTPPTRSGAPSAPAPRSHADREARGPSAPSCRPSSTTRRSRRGWRPAAATPRHGHRRGAGAPPRPPHR